MGSPLSCRGNKATIFDRLWGRKCWRWSEEVAEGRRESESTNIVETRIGGKKGKKVPISSKQQKWLATFSFLARRVKLLPDAIPRRPIAGGVGMALKYCSKLVFKSFRKVERITDRITGRAGPVFVGLATILITGCAITFFEVVFPHRFLSPTTPRITTLCGTVWCIYLVYTFCFHVRPFSCRIERVVMRCILVLYGHYRSLWLAF